MNSKQEGHQNSAETAVEVAGERGAGKRFFENDGRKNILSRNDRNIVIFFSICVTQRTIQFQNVVTPKYSR